MQSRYQLRSKNSAFTLIELLVVIAIIAILAAILFPVFAQAREKARQTSCLSGTKQLGLAVYQYYQDYDEVTPNGTYRHGPSGGWAGQIAPYTKNVNVFRCPSDIANYKTTDLPSSYAINSNFATGGKLTDGIPNTSVAISDMTSPAKTVLFFEVEGNTNVDIRYLYENNFTPGPTGPQNFNSSPFGNGRLATYQPSGGGSIISCPISGTDQTLKHATGYMGLKDPNTWSVGCYYTGKEGRHSGGSNFLMADTHAKWFKGSQVSPGSNANTETADQQADRYGNAAGTAGNIPGGSMGATFSIR